MPFRAWGPGFGRQAGSWQENELGWHSHTVPIRQDGDSYGQVVYNDILKHPTEITNLWLTSDGAGGDETRPDNIAIPVVIYLGTSN